MENKKASQKIATIVFSIFLIAVVIFIVLNKPQPTQKTFEEVQKELKDKENIVLRLEKIPEQWQPTVEQCSSEILDKESRCLYNRAMDHNETTFCYAMEDAKWQSKCFRGIALNLDKIELCNLVMNKFQKSRCVTFFAIKHKDPKICASVEEPYWKEQCERYTTQGNEVFAQELQRSLK